MMASGLYTKKKKEEKVNNLENWYKMWICVV